jgi:uncharacterized protein (DUF58 family)
MTWWTGCPCPWNSRGPEGFGPGRRRRVDTDTADRRGAILALVLVLGLVSVAMGDLPLFLWTVALGGITGAIAAWSRVCWRGVEVSARFAPVRAFGGETVSLQIRIANAKRTPLPVVSVKVWLPRGLRPAEPGGPFGHTIRGFERSLSLPGRSEAVLDLPVSVRRRGEYWLERVAIELSDPFGLGPVAKELSPEAALLVMPEPRIAVPVDVRRRLPFGTPARAARMFEERERFAGVRPYEPGDPLNRIHWKLTGHASGLQVKLFEPTRSADVLLILDLAVGEPFWDSIYPEIAEDTIGWASYLARQAMQSGWRVGLAANTHFTRGRGPLRVPASSRPGHEAALFAALARMPNEATSDLAPLLREVGRRLTRDSTAVVLSARPGPWLQQEMVVLRRRGAAVLHLSPLEAAS